ncbi:MAG TPA: PHP domain-containing protein [Candidatus Omnitrophota bacterium]|nr:PHP domain-containing protein [Candidatus Omnitrophota bacterium]HRZ14454.1 PHP domain-containing protein [Candidatus Omnitrophota bacterium]
MSERLADLHVHTVFSDGTLTPQELIDRAGGIGLAALSVVDHDTVEGVRPSIDAGRRAGIEVLPGIELTAEYGDLEVHILGYLFDDRHPPLLKQLEQLKQNRIQRVHAMLAKLEAMDIHLAAGQVFALSSSGTVSRLHLARAMVQAGITASLWEAFDKYIGDRGPAYVMGFKLTAQEAIALILEAGGVPVLAHPYALRRNALIPELVAFGIKGLEVYYPEHSPSMVEAYLQIARTYNLVVTGGSDFHGQAKPDVKLGSRTVTYALVEALKKARTQ